MEVAGTSGTEGTAGVAGAAATEEMAAKAMPAATARDLNENIVFEGVWGFGKELENEKNVGGKKNLTGCQC